MESPAIPIPEMPQPADPRFWKSQAKRRRIGLMLADRAAGLLNLQRNQETTRRLVRKMQDGTLGRPEANGSAEDDEVEGIHVGDVYQWHNEQPPAPSPSPPPVAPTALSPPAAGPSPLTTALLTAATLLGGAAAGGGAMYLVGRDKDPPSAVAPVDTDLRYGLEIVRPATPETQP